MSCILDQQWNVFCPKPMRLIHGWYVVADGRIVEHAGIPAPDADTKLFFIVYKPTPADGGLILESGWKPHRDVAGQSGAPVVEKHEFDAPPGSRFEEAYNCFVQRPFANGISAVCVTEQFQTLWEGRFVKDQKEVKESYTVARVAKPDDSLRQFEPPSEPAPTKGEPIQPPKNLSFRGLSLTDADKLKDAAVMVDLETALKNHVIKAEGGKVTRTTQTDVVFKSPTDGKSSEFTVYVDRTKKVFFIQVLTRGSGPGTGIQSEFFGPFPGDPVDKLNLPDKKAGNTDEIDPAVVRRKIAELATPDETIPRTSKPHTG